VNVRPYPQLDFSGAIQNASSWLVKRPNELVNGFNVVFNDEIGSFRRRYGCEQVGDAFATNKTPRGGHTARFSTGSIRMVACNNSGDTFTIVRAQDPDTGAWSTIISDFPVNSEVFFFDYLDEVYVTGYVRATGEPLTPRNIDNTLNVSTSRNILNMPAAHYIAEWNGALYACNVKVGSVRYPDRAYESSPPLGAITYVRADQSLDVEENYVPTMTSNILPSGTSSASNEVNPGEGAWRAFDKAATEWTANATSGWIQYDFGSGNSRIVTSYAVTGAGEINRSPHTFNLAGSNNGSSWTTLDTQTAVPAWTASERRVYAFSNTTAYRYYRVTISSNKGNGSYTTLGELEFIGLAISTPLEVDSVRYLKAGMAIDVYTKGTDTKVADLTILSVDKATDTIYVVGQELSFGDNDEIWLDGRKGKRTILWNTDYPTTEDAEFFLSMPTGIDSDNAITAVIKSNNRLVLFARNSRAKFDGQTLKPTGAVGCISMRTLQIVEDDWMIWLDARGNIHARNDASGQQEKISKAIKRPVMQYVTQAALADASAGVIDSTYKLYLGTVQGSKVRICYDFDSNTWTIEHLGRAANIQITDESTGYVKPYFLSDDGKIYIDETGNTDAGLTIAMEAESGKSAYEDYRRKKLYGYLIFSENAAGMKVMVAVDGDQFITVGEITESVHWMPISEQADKKLPVGTAINTKFAGSFKGDPPKIEGMIPYYVPQEDVPSERGR